MQPPGGESRSIGRLQKKINWDMPTVLVGAPEYHRDTSMKTLLDVCSTIREIVGHIDQYVTPLFHAEYKLRNERFPPSSLVPDDELRRIGMVFAYSGGVQSSAVSRMIQGGHYDNAFAGFNVHAVRSMNPCDIYDEYWPSIKPIKNEAKLLWLVRASRVLAKGHSVMDFLAANAVPTAIQNPGDIELFWHGLNKVEKTLKNVHLSGMQSVTSQLHFLMGLGYDCVKPDRIVMNVAQTLGMVNSERTQANLIAVARLMQECAVEMKIRPAILDMYFLIQGEYTDAARWTGDGFTPWQTKVALVA
jgi:hypothetical protein